MEKIRLDNGDAVYVNKKQINFIIVHKTFVELNFCNGTYIINKENCKNFISEIEKEELKVNEERKQNIKSNTEISKV